MSMDQSKIIVHRANYIAVEEDPINYIERLVGKGFRNLEIDLTVTSPNTFKFCHPSQLDRAAKEHRFDSLLFDQLAQLRQVVRWVVDIKYHQVLGANNPPQQLIETIYKAFSPNVVFVAAQPSLLAAAHEQCAQTAQFFRDGVSSDTSFAPDYLVYKPTDKINRELSGVIIYCETLDKAKLFLEQGAAFVMVDGSLLLGAQM